MTSSAMGTLEVGCVVGVVTRTTPHEGALNCCTLEAPVASTSTSLLADFNFR